MSHMGMKDPNNMSIPVWMPLTLILLIFTRQNHNVGVSARIHRILRPSHVISCIINV